MNFNKIFTFIIFLTSMNINASEKLALKDEIRSLIPNSIISDNIKINLYTKKFTNKKLVPEDLCTDVKLVSTKLTNKALDIEIDPVILTSFSLNSSIPCLHKNSKNTAVGKIIRSIGFELDKKMEISKDYSFLNLSGWFRKGIFRRKITNLNVLTERMFDKDEVDNPKTTFAVNLELFLLDKNFKCKRANLYQYFSRKWGHYPYEQESCAANDLVLLKSQKIKEKEELLQLFKPENVYEIHYLFAGKGKKMMSRWGHSMFRIIICPDGVEKNKDCANDVTNNFVIGFRATVQDMRIDNLKGITGAYPSQISILPLMEVVEQYTTIEYRDVYSVPMIMTRLEKERFINKALEVYWSYEGNYFFLTNNCATEAMNLIRSTYANNKKIQKKVIHTPVGMFNYFQKNAMMDSAVLDDEKNAVYEGYLFKAADDLFNKSLVIFGFNPKDQNTVSKIQLMNPTDRFNHYIATVSKITDKTSQRQALASAMRIEDKIIQSLNQQFNLELIKILEGKDSESAIDASVLKEFQEMILENLKVSGHMSSLKIQSYGVPTVDEVDFESILNVQTMNDFLQDNADKLMSIVKKKVPNLLYRIEKSKENKSALLKEITNIIKK